ncbi:sensor domain-containing diguanylate cyclase [Glaciecola petra]|uniref:diguanylate cyclase n=1 Tax=Glaciecola petra TaxID=3075602 RepID=A0ABU2ZVW5_9ALTE|nr:diguanylate cyclase [Aestuariibacter sp. P117]MDT0596526.1 diguanylate cyclase [Aestuariibacter sp. P117]
MIKMDFKQDHKYIDLGRVNLSNKEHLPFFALRTFLYGINFGLLGAMTNAFLHISFFGNFTLFLGQLFVLFCLVTKGLNAAIITVIFTSVSAAIYANDPYLVVIFSLEMIVVHVLMRKGFFLFQSAMSYWLLIGIPLLLVLHALTSFASAEELFINGVTRAINGLIIVSVVAIGSWFLPSDYTYRKYVSKPPKLASLIFSLCMLTVTLPAMVIALFFIYQSTGHNEQNIARNLKSVAEQTTTMIDVEFARHINGLNTVANYLETHPNAESQTLLDAIYNNYPLFTSVIITNKDGIVTKASPNMYSQMLNNLNSPNVRDRDYFKQTKNTMEPFVSEAFIGRGFGNNLILSLSVPMSVNGNFNGIVQGAIKLDEFSDYNESSRPEDIQFIMSDKNGRILSKSNDLYYPILSNFDYEVHIDPLIRQLDVMKFQQETFIYAQAEAANEWQITVLSSPKTVTSMIVNYFFVFVVGIFVVLLGFALVAKALSRKITKPLVDITEHFPDKEFHPQIIKESHVSSEMVKLTRKLIDSHEVMSNFQEQLSEQVNNKTKQLKQLNRELYSIAQKDSLTQLLNRAGFNRLALTSYRNCIRNSIKMSLILIDIDHFKNINDTHGHPFGDKCIIAVAKVIQKYCKRDTDIIGRYGGEEFIIMIVGGEIEEHTQRIELIKNEIQNLRFKNNKEVSSMTISAGVCSLDNNFSIDYEDVLELADNQLYLSKRGGRNKISVVSK